MLAFAFVAGACAGGAASTTTVSSTTTVATTSTTTTTTVAVQTPVTVVPTTEAVRQVTPLGDLPPPLLEQLGAVFSYIADPRNEVPDVPDGLVTYLEEVTPPPGPRLSFSPGSLVEPAKRRNSGSGEPAW